LALGVHAFFFGHIVDSAAFFGSGPVGLERIQAMGCCLQAASNPKVQMPVITRISRRRQMTFLARTRRRLQKMSPYLSLVLLLIPLLLLFVERFFRIVKPKLMTLSWFARLWTKFTALRCKIISWTSKTPSEANRTN
jgi:hypothetical protein